MAACEEVATSHTHGRALAANGHVPLLLEIVVQLSNLDIPLDFKCRASVVRALVIEDWTDFLEMVCPKRQRAKAGGFSEIAILQLASVIHQV